MSMYSLIVPAAMENQRRLEREIQAKQDTEENRMIDAFLEIVKDDEDFAGHERHHYSCWSYKAYREQIFNEIGLEKSMWKWFRIYDYIAHEWKTEQIIILYKRKGDEKVLHLHDLFFDDERCMAFFKNAKGTPDEDRFFVLRYTG